MSGFREKYVDTLGKLYEYCTTFFENRPMSEMLGTDLKYTYGSFKHKCDDLSRYLSRYGIGAGDRVAILSINTPANSLLNIDKNIINNNFCFIEALN